MCAKGGHEFPVEDSRGAYCPDHGVTLLYRGDPIRPEDLAHDEPVRPHRSAIGPTSGEVAPHEDRP